MTLGCSAENHQRIIAYDLMNPGQNYESVQAAIQSLGKYAKLQFSLYYVHTALNAREAHNFVAAVIDANDRLLVVDAIGGVVSSPQWLVDSINDVWFDDKAA